MKQLLCCLVLFCVACQPAPATVTEINPQIIPVDISQTAELSGLAWYQDTLLILPQYPHEFQDKISTLTKSEIVNYLDGETSFEPTLNTIPFLTDDIHQQIDGFEGFEALLVNGQTIYATIEAEEGDKTTAYLVTGSIETNPLQITLDSDSLIQLETPTNITNAGYEALVMIENELISIYEANGAFVNTEPFALSINSEEGQISQSFFPNIEYRITDATQADNNNRFWVINTLRPEHTQRLYPATDLLVEMFGRGTTHTAQRQRVVERLVQLEYIEDTIQLANTPPIQLQLHKEIRNWEGIARLDELGLLLVTDTRPETLLVFVPFP